MDNLDSLSDSALTDRLYRLCKQERYVLVDLLHHLGELDARKLYRPLGFPSLWAFCTGHLGFSSSATYRRTTCCRLLRRFPAIADYLGDGRLNLTTLSELRNVLKEENLQQVLDRAAGRTEDDVKKLLAALEPRPEPPDLLRRLPQPSTAGPAVQVTSPEPQPPQTQLFTAPPPPTPKPEKIEPLSGDRRLLRLSVSAEFASDLEKVRDALSHTIPDRKLERVLHACILGTLKVCERRKVGSDNPRLVPPRRSKSGRHIPVAEKNIVWRRDEGRCAFVSADGRRCGSTYKVQFHHIVPHAKGGPSTASNLTLRCASHNAYHAEQDFGAQHMSTFTAAH